MRLTPKQLADIVEAVTGNRTAMLTISEFAQVTNRDRREVWRDCIAGTIKATQQSGVKGHWKIPITELRTYLEAAA